MPECGRSIPSIRNGCTINNIYNKNRSYHNKSSTMEASVFTDGSHNPAVLEIH